MIRATRTIVLAVPAALLLAACRPAAERAPSRAKVHAVAASQEPHHHLVYSNELAHVMDVRVPAGDTTLFHIHAYPLVGVALRNARSWDQLLDSAPSPIDTVDAVPEELDNWDRPRPYTHRVANVDRVGFHYLVAEVLKSSGVACDSLPDTPNRRVVKSGPAAIIYELRIAPHSRLAPHSHACPGLVVQGTPGTLLMDGPPPIAFGGVGAGAWRWHGKNLTHVLRNEGLTPLIAYEIDWK